MLLNNGKDWRMPPEDKAEWVAALRSGDFKQGQAQLCHVLGTPGESEQYCCLGVYGVLKDLFRKTVDYDKRVAKGRTRDFRPLGTTSSVREAYLPATVFPAEVQFKLSELNDDGDYDSGHDPYDFEQIADWIEENL